MRAVVLFACLAMIASCGTRPLSLPESPIDRAATCGVVAAAEARASVPDVRAPLPFDAQGKILHHVLLGASQAGEFSPERAVEVNQRMNALQEPVIGGRWKDLVPECRSAFPATATVAPILPRSAFDARLGCDALAEFLGKALAKQRGYGDELLEYRKLTRRLDASTMVSTLQSRTGDDLQAQQEERHKALAAMAHVGPPMATMRECLRRFG